jgi:hypothetical protein
MLIPWVGLLFLPLLRPTTYYERDTTTMYRTAIDKAVKEVVDELIHTQGLRPLTELERKPILKDFF